MLVFRPRGHRHNFGVMIIQLQAVQRAGEKKADTSNDPLSIIFLSTASWELLHPPLSPAWMPYSHIERHLHGCWCACSSRGTGTFTTYRMHFQHTTSISTRIPHTQLLYLFLTFFFSPLLPSTPAPHHRVSFSTIR